MRLFISIDFPDDILGEVRSWLPEQKGWKKVKNHQMHLTLAFLGDCSGQEKEEIHSVLSEIDFSPFKIAISGLGAFPNESSPRIIWAGIEPTDPLMSLQEEISERLQDFIKSKESHSYIPHITLARKKSRKGINHVVKQNLKRKTTEIELFIDSFHLKESILKSSGSEHHILHTYQAKSNE
ncbi:MAG: RNA 2',3'-cyclic phosphodiesterase [Balneolaceae bacterium]|nr:RNA 2',3'-cyclic phosphodiesterase [Balneolaceae bacterium]